MNPAIEKREKATLGFWLYLMTDAMVFACLFATYMILKSGTNGLPGPSELFSPSYALIETIILLVSSFLCGLANLALHHGRHRQFEWFLGGTLLLGTVFVALELGEFANLVADGNVPSASAFLTGFFSLVGLHGLHILVGLLWGCVLIWAMHRQGVHEDLRRKFGLFAMYWHFLDIIWIFIFTIVYMMGVL